MNKQENTKKMPIFSMYQMNEGVVVVCNHKGSYIILNQHCLGTYQNDKHSKHMYGPTNLL